MAASVPARSSAVASANRELAAGKMAAMLVRPITRMPHATSTSKSENPALLPAEGGTIGGTGVDFIIGKNMAQLTFLARYRLWRWLGRLALPPGLPQTAEHWPPPKRGRFAD